MVFKLKRKSPVEHKVKTHIRDNIKIRSFKRGSGTKSVIKPMTFSGHSFLRKPTVKYDLTIPRDNILKEEISFKFSPRMIQTLGASLYKRKIEASIREPIQNAIDSGSTSVMVHSKDIGNGKVLIQILDEGKGMTKEEIQKYIATVGESSKADKKGKVGKFGIGKLAPFMVAEETYIATQPSGKPLSLVSVSQTGLNIEGDNIESRMKFDTKGIEIPTHGTNVAFVLDTYTDEFRNIFYTHGMEQPRSSSPNDKIEAILKHIIGPVSRPIYFKNDNTDQINQVTEVWHKIGPVKEDLSLTDDPYSEVKIFSNGLYVQNIDVAFLTGSIDMNFRNSIALNREELQKETTKQRREYEKMERILGSLRDKSIFELNGKLTPANMSRVLKITKSKTVKNKLLESYTAQILDGNILRKKSLDQLSRGDKVVITPSESLERSRTLYENFSHQTGTTVVFIDNMNDEKYIKSYFRSKGITLKPDKQKRMGRKEKSFVIKRFKPNEKALTQEIKRRFNINFGWAYHSDPSTIAYAQAGKIYMNRNSPTMQDVLESKIPLKDKALYMLGTTAHEWAHIQTNTGDGHSDEWRSSMESLKYDLVRASKRIDPMTIEGTVPHNKKFKLPMFVLATDDDKIAEMAWAGDKLIAKVGDYNLEIDAEFRNKTRVGHSVDSIKDGKLDIKPKLIWDKKHKNYGDYVLTQRNPKPIKTINTGSKVIITQEGIYNNWSGKAGELVDKPIMTSDGMQNEKQFEVTLNRKPDGTKTLVVAYFTPYEMKIKEK